ncbi:MAG: hypothetical protein MJ051_04550 [Akkermansia sp.]|nr:hypothetical protein [Akkermansia sp.]
MNRRSLFLSLVSLAAMALPTQAATMRSYPDALSKAGHKPIVLFCYGANYDEVSKKAYEEFVKQHKLQSVLQKCIFVEVPIYQLPDERQKREMEKVIGKAGLPGGIFSYPSLAVVDDGGNLRGIVQKADEIQDVEAAKAALAKLLEAYDQQESLITKAEKAGGTVKAKLLMQAAEVRGVNLPPDAGEGGKRNKGMKDNVGLGARQSFDPITVMEKTFTMDSNAEVETYIRGLLNKPGYSLAQRQEMLAALAGHLRRNNGSVDKIRSLYTEMRELDPDSMYGAYAQGALDMWVDKKPIAATAPSEINRTNNAIISDSDGPSVVINDNSADDTDDTPVINDGHTAMGTRAGAGSTPKKDEPQVDSMEDE